MKPYDEDLARIHDDGFGDHARGAAPFLLKLLRQRRIIGGLVVDLGCGSGIWAAELHNACYEVLGVDISEAMIKIARTRAPEAQFRVGSLLRCPLPRCQAVTSLGECLNYLFDRTNGIRALRSLFRRVYHALEPGGVFIFDVAEPGRGTPPRSFHAEGEDWAILALIREARGRRRLTRRITTFRKSGNGFRRCREVHHLKLFPHGEIAGMLRETGFRVRLLRGFGSQPFPKGLSGFLAAKPPLLHPVRGIHGSMEIL